MPRFYFDVYDGDNIVSDRCGDDFDSDDEAARQAASLIPDLARDRIVKDDNLNVAISVRDDTGEVIYRSIAAIRSQRQGKESFPFRIRIDDAYLTISRSRRLRAEMCALSERMHVDVAQIFSTIESAAANMEVSYRLLRGGDA